MRLQKTSRYFLRHLVPRSALTADQRARLEDELRSGETDAMRRLAEELAQSLGESGRFQRLAPGRFRDPASGIRFRLPVLREREMGRAPSKIQPLIPARSPESPVPVLQQLESVLGLLKLEGRRSGLERNLERLTSLFGEWFPRARCVLYRRDAADSGEAAGQSLEPETLAPGHPYRVAMESGEPVWLSGQEAQPGWFPPRSLPPGMTVALLPLRLEQETWGLLEFSLPPDLDRELSLESMGILARAMTQQVHNHRVLSQVVFVDWLTQVYNRAFYDLQLPLEIERATRNGENLALLVADLDNFKQINDSFGHDMGDRVLKEFAAQIRQTLRKVDMIFRYGGEEFVILLPRLDRDSALRAAERLRDAIAAHRFETDREGEILQVTASFGGAIYPIDALAEGGLFKAADEACYRAKHAGKNRVVFAEGSA